MYPQLLSTADNERLEDLLADDDYGCQEKKDGKRLIIWRCGNNYGAYNKNGIPCECPDEIFNSIPTFCGDTCLDGELIKNKFYAWDLLEINGRNYSAPTAYSERHKALSSINFGKFVEVVSLITGTNDKYRYFEHLKSMGFEGIVFKKLDAPYSGGRGRDQWKYKFYNEASCIVVEGRVGKKSIGLELINEIGERVFVGFCTCNKSAPVGSVVEIKYLYAFRGGCLYQPEFKMIRDDVNTLECTTIQLKYKT
jgi:bifunctional non-homologous end joining protein LigD